MSFKRQLHQHLLAGETEAVLRALTVLADQLGDNGLMNDVVHQHRRFRQLCAESQAGILTDPDQEHRRRQIQQVLLLVIEGLPE